ncbi:UAP56-interacting factor [Solea senegalensis]|uniref:UAP56-interacting factor n=2 Tax=Solea senegalensis TaxID=28829 RepID=A0AAV6T4E7_SOLSE|nr:UAP56-interacting factor-like [Solea senegalensis]KAG7524272.1 UAP56-interacting factor [Solea senegalensis]
MSQSSTAAGRPAVQDKVDMSLDDIIRLNRREQQLRRKQTTMSRRPVKKKKQLLQRKGVSARAAGPVQRGGGIHWGGAPKLRNRRIPPLLGLRRGQGVITGLAARRPAALLKRVSTLNRAAINQKTRQKPRPFIQSAEGPYRKPEFQRRQYGQPDPQRVQNQTPVRRPFQLRRGPLPPIQQTRRDTRQATFLFRRGLKVQAQVQKPVALSPPVRTRQWRTSTASSGILTVSIDNPTARTQPEPPSAWTLHPPAVSSAPVKVETVEKKIPKGVPLQFDINSVGKPQTSMTLNERFRILKDRRTTMAQNGKGSRFVTVG